MTRSFRDIGAMFADSLCRLTGSNPAMSDLPQIGLAVSGGPDSLALMLLAYSAFPKAISVATVDHGLRPEAAAEAAHVARLCAERKIPHTTLRPDAPITGNLQSAARDARCQPAIHQGCNAREDSRRDQRHQNSGPPAG